MVSVPHAVTMHVALGTSIALVVPSAIASTWKQIALGNLDLGYFRTWALGILAGVLIGLAVLRFVSTEALQIIFAMFMLSLGIYEGFLKDRMVVAKSAPRGPV